MRRRGRGVLLWTLGCFAALQLGLAVGSECFHPAWSDPEYGYRVTRLQRRLTAEPDKPLLVVLGSSRVSNGFHADLLPPAECSAGPSPVVFNMSLAGGTPLMELLLLRRMLALGLRPDYLLIEIRPPCLSRDERWLNSELPTHRVRWTDLDVFRRYAPDLGWRQYLAWIEWNSVPWYSNRYSLLGRYAPHLLAPSDRSSTRVQFWRRSLSPGGWLPLGEFGEDARLQGREIALRNYAPHSARFELSAKVDEILREMLGLCARERIKVLGLVLMPESSEFRRLCPPETRVQVHDYLTGLCRQFDTELLDAGTWIDDRDFYDGHHLLQPGAEVFTRRLWEEFLEPRLSSPPIVASRVR
jgi:hypothetical protein